MSGGTYQRGLAQVWQRLSQMGAKQPYSEQSATPKNLDNIWLFGLVAQTPNFVCVEESENAGNPTPLAASYQESRELKFADDRWSRGDLNR